MAADTNPLEMLMNIPSICEEKVKGIFNKLNFTSLYLRTFLIVSLLIKVLSAELAVLKGL